MKKQCNGIFIALLVTLMFPFYGFSQEITITKVGEWGTGDYRDVFIQGNYAYCAAEDSGLDILSIADPLILKKVANHDTQGQALAIHVVGHYAYVADGGDGLTILDISTPSAPVPVGHYGASGSFHAIYVSGSHAYILDSIDHLVVIDVSNPASPRTVGSLGMADPVRICVSGDHAYITDNNRIEIIDISDPSAPAAVGAYSRVISDVAISIKDNFLLAADYPNGFQVIDVSDPSAPVLAGSASFAHPCEKMEVNGDYAYIACFDGLQIVDITTPTTPVAKGFYKLAKGEYFAVSVSGGNAYCAANHHGMDILDISDPDTPALAGTFNQSGRLNGFTKAGGYVYLADGKAGLQVIDVSNPSRPVMKGACADAADAWDVAIDDNYAYVTSGNKLTILDISSPGLPQLIQTLPLTYPSSGIRVNGGYAYIAQGYSGFVVIDVSDPTLPTKAGSWETEHDNAHTLCLDGNFVYLADGLNGLHILDVSDPSAPKRLGNYSEPSLVVNDVHVNGNDMYLACLTDGLKIIDISDPAIPVLKGVYDTPGRTLSVWVEGDYTFIADDNSGLQVIDVSNPSAPTLAGNYAISGSATKVAVENDYVYIANSDSGKLIIFRVKPTGSTDTPRIALNRSLMNFTAVNGLLTGSQPVLLTNSGSGNLTWTAAVDRSWLKCSPVKGTNSTEIFVSVDATGLSPGDHTGTLSVSAPLAENSPQRINITLKILGAGSGSSPFGVFSSPSDGSTVSSSVPVTGWALDDVGIQSVQIFREEGNSLTYIGDAVFVEGARTDVEDAYPGYPNNHKAGWGYMMLTNYLSDGDGEYRIHAIVTDIEGNSTGLGVKTIYVNNADAVKPFGAIDTPEQGGLATGSQYVNFGWVLAPQPNTIPKSGNSIWVYIDGVPVGHPVYNQYRDDIAAFFPGYNNSSGAVGYFYLDTTQYENGIHSIQWTATDDAGNTDGIGSRYIKIMNPVPRSATADKSSAAVLSPASHVLGEDLDRIPLDVSTPVQVRKGFDPGAPMHTILPDENGIINIRIREMERIEVHLDCNKGEFTGKLPPGCTWDSETGILSWFPAHGFYGDYVINFIEKRAGGSRIQRHIRVTIQAKY